MVVLLNCTRREARSAARRQGRARSIDLRTYGIGAQILRDLGVGKMRLMAAPRKMPSMAGFGLEVTGYAERPAAASAERCASGIVASRFNEEIAGELLERARAERASSGASAR